MCLGDFINLYERRKYMRKYYWHEEGRRGGEAGDEEKQGFRSDAKIDSFATMGSLCVCSFVLLSSSYFVFCLSGERDGFSCLSFSHLIILWSE